MNDVYRMGHPTLRYHYPLLLLRGRRRRRRRRRRNVVLLDRGRGGGRRNITPLLRWRRWRGVAVTGLTSLAAS